MKKAIIGIFFILFTIQFNFLLGNVGTNEHNDPFYKKAKSFYDKDLKDSASVYFLKSIAFNQERKSWDGLTRSYADFAFLMIDYHHRDSSRFLLNRAQKVVESHKNINLEDVIAYYNTEGYYYTRFHRPDSALFFSKKVLQIKKQLYQDPNHLEFARSYNNLGLAYNDIQENSLAVAYFDSALTVVKEALGVDSRFASTLIFNKSNAMAAMGNYNEAIEYNTTSLGILKKLVDHNNAHIGNGYITLANKYLSRKYSGDVEKGLNCLNKASEILSMTEKGKSYLYYTFYSYASAYLQLDDFDLAKYYINKAVRHNIETFGEDFIHLGYCYQFLGKIYLKEEKFDSSRQYLSKSINHYQNQAEKDYREISKNHSLLGEVAKQANQYEEAINHANMAVDMLLPDYRSENMMDNPSVTQLVSDENLFDALHLKAESLNRIYEERNLKEYLLASLNTYQLLVKLITLSRKELFAFNNKISVNQETNYIFEEALKVALKCFDIYQNDKYLKMAMQIMEDRKSSIMTDQINQISALKFSNVPDTLLRKEKNLKTSISVLSKQIYDLKQKNAEAQQIATVDNELFGLKLEYELLENHIEKKFPVYYLYKYYNQFSVTNSFIRQLEKQRTLMIEYFMGKEDLYVLVLGEGVFDYYQVQIDDLNDHVNEFLKAITSRQKAVYLTYAYQLYQKLLAEAFEIAKTSTIEKVYIVPDGSLGYLPFELLTRTEYDKSAQFKDLDFLIKDYTVAHHYSAKFLSQTLKKSKNPKTDKRNFIGFAPTFDKPATNLLATRAANDQQLISSLTNLPYAQKEVKEIANLLNGEIKIRDATEKNFKAQAKEFDIIHVASHAIINHENPLYSKLVFSPENDNQEDGLLHTYELFNMELNANLVVLSACKSGVGKILNGEGVVSLARGFMYTGVPNALMSLWSVSDLSTASIMQYFYQQRSKGLSYAESLRLAKLKYLEEADDNMADPYYWGGFVFLGEMEADNSFFSNYFKIISYLVFTTIVLVVILYFVKKSNRVKSKEQVISK